MIKKILLIGLLVSLVWPPLTAQLRFQKLYGYSNQDTGRELDVTSDGGFIMVGRSAGIGNCYVIRTDFKGDTIWTHDYGYFDVEGAQGIHQTSDHGFVIAGYTYSFGSGSQMLIIKTDSSGNVQWTKTYGGAGGEQAICVRQTTNGGYIVAGASTTNGAGVEDAAVLRLDASGTILWAKRFGSTSYDQAQCVRQTPDGGFIIAGSTSQSSGFYIYLMRTDANGDTLWVKRYGNGNEATKSVELTNDGNFIVAGASGSNSEVILFKVDNLGNVLWSMAYGGPDDDGATGVKQTSDGGYIITGNTASFGAGGNDVYLLKTDSIGTLQWSMAYGGPTGDSGLGVDQLSDGGYIVLGTTPNIGSYNGFYLIKTDALGVSNCNETVTPSSSASITIPVSNPVWVYSTGWTEHLDSITAYNRFTTIATPCTNLGIEESMPDNKRLQLTPNPSTGNFMITNLENAAGMVQVIDQLGKLIYEVRVDDVSETEFSLTNVVNGIYLVKVTCMEHLYFGKLLLNVE